MEKFICQSCAMPMEKADFGTNANGTRNEEYCHYCFENGHFTAECTMNEMIDFCVPHVIQGTEISAESAKEFMQAQFPKLKRWAI